MGCGCSKSTPVAEPAPAAAVAQQPSGHSSPPRESPLPQVGSDSSPEASPLAVGRREEDTRRKERRKRREEDAKAAREENERAAKLEEDIAPGRKPADTWGKGDEDEDEDEDEVGAAPEFAKGKQVRLRQADPGRKRIAAKPDLTSGYALHQISLAVDTDLAWEEEASVQAVGAGRGPAASDAPVSSFAAVPGAGANEIPKWRTIWIYVVSCIEDSDTDVEAQVLHTVVLPLLRAKYSQRMVHVLLCDPRQGLRELPHSPEMAAHFLDELEGCTTDSEGILFVALRGSLYSWVPKEKTEVPEGLRDEWPYGCSLQAAEMRCALALGGGKTRGVVCYRENAPGLAGASALEDEKASFEKEAGVRVLSYGLEGGGDLDGEGIEEFEHLVRSELDLMLEEWCTSMNMPRPLSEIGRAEVAREAAVIGGPAVKKAIGRRRSSVSLLNKKDITRPTFRQTVAWRCHRALAERVSRSLAGNPSALGKVYSSIREGRMTTMLVGKEGSGKTTIMARVARRFAILSDDGWLVLQHFAGAGHNWLNVRGMVRRFCAEISEALQIHSPVQQGITSLASQFVELLIKATTTYGINVLCLVDGYDQMESTQHALTHIWLPTNDIPAFHVVLSMTEGSGCHLRVSQRIENADQVKMPSLSSEEISAVCAAALGPDLDASRLPIAKLSETAFLNSLGPLWAGTACRTLAVLAANSKLDVRDAPPLTGIFDGARKESRGMDNAAKKEVSQAVYKQLSNIAWFWIRDMPGLVGLIEPLLLVLEYAHGFELVRDLLSLVTCADNGLPEPVILAMLQAEEEEDEHEHEHEHEHEDEYQENDPDWDDPHEVYTLDEEDEAQYQFVADDRDGNKTGFADREEALKRFEQYTSDSMSERREGMGVSVVVEGVAFENSSVHLSGASFAVGAVHSGSTMDSGRPVHISGGNFGEASTNGGKGLSSIDWSVFEKKEEGDDLAEMIGAESSHTRWHALRHLLEPFLQATDELDPSGLRIANRSISRAIRGRYMTEEDIMMVHRRIASYLVDEAAGVWDAENGVRFRTYEQLDEQPLALEELPRHLSMAGAWTDCIQLLCDLSFLRRRIYNQLTENHVEDCRRSLTLLTESIKFPETIEGQQLEELKRRMIQIIDFIEQDREVLHRLPELTAQQATNQPEGSAPEMCGMVELTFEPRGRARFGKRSGQAVSAEQDRQKTNRNLVTYHPGSAFMGIDIGIEASNTSALGNEGVSRAQAQTSPKNLAHLQQSESAPHRDMMPRVEPSVEGAGLVTERGTPPLSPLAKSNRSSYMPFDGVLSGLSEGVEFSKQASGTGITNTPSSAGGPSKFSKKAGKYAKGRASKAMSMSYDGDDLAKLLAKGNFDSLGSNKGASFDGPMTGSIDGLDGFGRATSSGSDSGKGESFDGSSTLGSLSAARKPAFKSLKRGRVKKLAFSFDGALPSGMGSFDFDSQGQGDEDGFGLQGSLIATRKPRSESLNRGRVKRLQSSFDGALPSGMGSFDSQGQGDDDGFGLQGPPSAARKPASKSPNRGRVKKLQSSFDGALPSGRGSFDSQGQGDDVAESAQKVQTFHSPSGSPLRGAGAVIPHSKTSSSDGSPTRLASAASGSKHFFSRTATNEGSFRAARLHSVSFKRLASEAVRALERTVSDGSSRMHPLKSLREARQMEQGIMRMQSGASNSSSVQEARAIGTGQAQTPSSGQPSESIESSFGIAADVPGADQIWVEHVNKAEAQQAHEDSRGVAGYNHTCLSPDEVPCCGVALVSVSGTDGCIRLFDAVSMLEMYQLSGHSDGVNCTAFSSECDRLASASDDCSLRVWSMPDYDNINRVVRGRGACICVCRGKPQGSSVGHSDAVTQCEFTPDGLSLVSASDDRTIRTWDPRTGALFHRLEGHSGWVQSIVCSPTSSLLASASDDGMLRLWDIGITPHLTDTRGTMRGLPMGELIGHSSPVLTCAFSPDGRYMASGADDHAIRVWNVEKLSVQCVMLLTTSPAVIRFDREAWRLWAVLEDNTLVILDIANHAKPIAVYPFPRIVGGGSWAIQPEAGNTCTCAGGDGIVYSLRLHNAVHKEPLPSNPPQLASGGVIGIADDDDDTEEVEWQEYSGPLKIMLERKDGSRARASITYTTYGTNDEDPDFTPMEGTVEWDDGDTQPKPLWISMRSYNGIEWDAMALVRRIDPDTGDEVKVPSRIAAFGIIAYTEGKVARTRPWHPPLESSNGLAKYQLEVEDAKKEYSTGAEGSEQRLARCERELQEVISMGSDADVGLTHWSNLRGKVAVIDLDCVLTKHGFSDPKEFAAVYAEKAIEVSKRAHRAGAKGVIIFGCDDEIIVLKKKDPDIFNEDTGQWDPDALDADKVPIPVVCVPRSQAIANRMRNDTMAAIVPTASNHAHWVKTGMLPKVAIDMEGDTEFDVLLKDPQGATLDGKRARVKVRIVTEKEMKAKEERMRQEAVKNASLKELEEADVAEAVALQERQEADEAIAAYLKEEAQAAEAEAKLEALSIESDRLSMEADSRLEDAQEYENELDELKDLHHATLNEVRDLAAKLKEMEFKLTQIPKKQKEERATLQKDIEELSSQHKERHSAKEREHTKIQDMSKEAIRLWDVADVAQGNADAAYAAVEQQEAVYRRERAEADLARIKRDKEVAEAEEAERNAARERAEAEEAMRIMEERRKIAEESQKRQDQLKADFEKKVEEALSSMADAEQSKLDVAEAAKKQKEAAEQLERERMQQMLADLEEKRQAEASLQAKRIEEADAEWKKLQAEREEAAREKEEELARRNAERFPWRRYRKDLDAGYSRRPAPRMAQNALQVAHEWEAYDQTYPQPEGPGARKHLEALPANLQKAALSLGSQDYLQALSVWDNMPSTIVLEEDALKLSGRLAPEDDHEDDYAVSQEMFDEYADEFMALTKARMSVAEFSSSRAGGGLMGTSISGSFFSKHGSSFYASLASSPGSQSGPDSGDPLRARAKMLSSHDSTSIQEQLGAISPFPEGSARLKSSKQRSQHTPGSFTSIKGSPPGVPSLKGSSLGGSPQRPLSPAVASPKSHSPGGTPPRPFSPSVASLKTHSPEGTQYKTSSPAYSSLKTRSNPGAVNLAPPLPGFLEHPRSMKVLPDSGGSRSSRSDSMSATQSRPHTPASAYMSRPTSASKAVHGTHDSPRDDGTYDGIRIRPLTSGSNYCAQMSSRERVRTADSVLGRPTRSSSAARKMSNRPRSSSAVTPTGKKPGSEDKDAGPPAEAVASGIGTADGNEASLAASVQEEDPPASDWATAERNDSDGKPELAKAED